MNTGTIMTKQEVRLAWYVAADTVRREESARRLALMAEYRADGYGEETAYLLAQGQIDPWFGDVPFQDAPRQYLGEEIQERRRRDRMEERGI